MSIESDGRSADETLTIFDEPDYNPESGSDDSRKLSQVWISADNLRKLLANKGDPSSDERVQLGSAIIYQLNTIFLYWQMGVFFRALREHRADSKTISLYILLFPGEAKDNTGIKDLNDNVIGQWWNGEFIRRRFAAIHELFDERGGKFMVAAQTYKTAYIWTYEGTRKDFVAKLAELDEKLRIILLQILDAAKEDANEKQRKEIRKLRKKLKKKGYRFDIFFGLKTLKPARKSKLEDVYLLVTEALKGAAIARYVAKTMSLKTRVARKFAKGIDPDNKKLDARGKEYDWNVYIKASDMAEKIKTLFVKGYTADMPYQLNEIYVDTVWTVAFRKLKKLYLGNPDVVRDVRKKKLESAPLMKGNMTYGFPIQKDLLELWLVVLNMLDFVKRFKFDEFQKELLRYHEDMLEVFTQVGTSSKKIDWAKLEKLLTHDVRQKEPVAVFESASEFQFYSYAADHDKRIFFSMDIRDMGVELMLHYEHSNREIGYHRHDGVDLMKETFRASDAIDERRRFTCDQVVEVFKKYYDLLSRNPGAAMKAALQAFGAATIDRLGSFKESVQIMLGGDEVYAAAHPLFDQYVPNIIGDLNKTLYDKDQTLNMRASVAFSSAKKLEDPQQRQEIQLSHQEALRLAEEAPGYLKFLERTHRRIERLIDMLESNDKKKSRGPGYRNELEKLPLMKLFARSKHGKPQRLNLRDFRTLLDALRRGDIKAAEKTKNFELVDFNGNVVNGEKLEKDAEALEARVRRDVGPDNTRVHPPPATKMPKWIDKLLDCWENPPC